jgi:hypothetical protein
MFCPPVELRLPVVLCRNSDVTMPVDCDLLHGVVRGDDLYFAKKMFQFALEYSGMQVLKKLCMNEAVQDFGRVRYNDSSFASYEVHSIVFLIARQISGSSNLQIR